MATFSCTLCGECCRGDQMVWLSPVDLQRLSAHLGFDSIGELESRRIIVRDKGEHGIQRPRLRFPLGPAGPACRFLINEVNDEGLYFGKCELHMTPAKPLVCRLAPLSRTVDLDSGEEDWKEVPPVLGCPGWENPPPPSGCSIENPKIDPELRRDLEAENAYFRSLTRENGVE